ncbi:hypothetical protein [Streptomyces sp. NPDC093598]|uniref:hypothetical protein n=1 Tax=Streptomyces sp. NPDC093598 TaxID=3366046 RepID=UPI0038308CD5
MRNLVWIPITWYAASAVMAARTAWRQRRHLPAAPDNLPPADIDAYLTCRRINALPTASRKENPQP